MTKIQSHRVEREYRDRQKERRGYFKDAFYEFIASQPLDAILPGPIDTALRPQIQQLVDAPVEEDITVSTFENVLQTSFPQITAEWRRSVDEHLLDLMKYHVPDATMSDLSRPTTIFRCDRCHVKRNIYYPQVLAHPCTVPLCHPSKEEIKAVTLDLNSVDPGYYDIFRLGGLWFDRAARDHCVKLLQGCGIDPNAVTLEELHVPSFILECEQCSQAMVEKPRTLMTWDQAVRCPICPVFLTLLDHEIGNILQVNHNLVHQELKLSKAILTEEDMVLVTEALTEAARTDKLKCLYFDYLVCVPCRRSFNWSDLRLHFKERCVFPYESCLEFRSYYLLKLATTSTERLWKTRIIYSISMAVVLSVL